MPDLFPFGECSSLCVGSVQAKQAVSISGAPGASFQRGRCGHSRTGHAAPGETGGYRGRSCMTLRSIDGGQARGAGPLREVGQASMQAVPAVPADPRPPQMPWLAVYLTVKDGEASLEFYRRAFGFLPGNLMRDDQGALMHAELHYKGEIPVMFTPETAPDCTTPSPATLGITMPVFFHFYQ